MGAPTAIIKKNKNIHMSVNPISLQGDCTHYLIV